MIEGSLNSKLKFVVCLGLGSSHMHDVLVLCVSARVRLFGSGALNTDFFLLRSGDLDMKYYERVLILP